MDKTTLQPRQRFGFIDLSRSIAIALALFSHAINQFLNDAADGSDLEIGIKIATRAAMPTFMVLFGVMIELVYMRKLETSHPFIVRNRLFLRSFLCYLGYLAIIAAAIIGGYLGYSKAIRGVFFFENIRNGNALKYYAVALFLTWFLLLFRRKFGVHSVIILTAAVWITTPFLKSMPMPSPESSLGKLCGFLLGVPPEGSSIYVAQSIWFINAGILLGHSLRVASTQGVLVPFIKMSLGIGSFSLILLISIFSRMQPGEILLGIAGKFRMSNHIAYYAWGTLQALVIMWICLVLVGIRPSIHPWIHRLSVFGRNSLLAFCIGNVILNLIPTYQRDLPWAIGLSVLFILLLGFGFFAFEGFDKKRKRINTKTLAST